MAVRLALRYQIAALACFAACLPMVLWLGWIALQYPHMHRQVNAQLQQLAEDDLAEIARGFYATCRVANANIAPPLDQAFASLRQELAKTPPTLDPRQRAQWIAHPPDHEDRPTAIELPTMVIAGTPANPKQHPWHPWLSKASATNTMTLMICQRINPEGDMLCIAANRIHMVGRLRNATEDPVIQTVRKGKTYAHLAKVDNTLQLVRFAPLTDAKGQIIGMFGVADGAATIQAVQQAASTIRIQQTGYLWALQATGPQRGCYDISYNNKSNGQSIYNATDASGQQFVPQMLDKALALPAGEHGRPMIAYQTYPWLKRGQGKQKYIKISAITAFKPWNWVIGAGVYLDEYHQATQPIASAMNRLIRDLILGGLVMVTIVLVIAWWFGLHLARPIARLTAIAGIVANGKLDEARKRLEREGQIYHPTRETQLLHQAMSEMAKQLTRLITGMKQASVNLMTTANQLAATSREQSATVNQFGASTNQIAAAVREISATDQELLTAMNDVNQVADHTAEIALNGRGDLKTMTTTIGRLEQATAAISAKLGLISDKANDINLVITTITKVADQTNLLSVNAAIEAEKAGELGHGFLVVAREIRRLADQTAVATLDIEQMVKQMQASVSAGVMEMDKFSQQVRQSVHDADQISTQFDGIIDQVQALTPRFQHVNEQMANQTIGAQQISQAMGQLTDGARQSGQSLNQIAQASDRLRHAVNLLNQEIQHFQLGQVHHD